MDKSKFAFGKTNYILLAIAAVAIMYRPKDKK